MRILFLAAAVLLGAAGCASQTFPRNPTSQEIAALEGVYGLSDGFRARLFGLDDRLYVRIGALPEHALDMVGPDRLASPRGEVEIQLQPDWLDHDVDPIKVAYYRPAGMRPPLRFSSGWRPGRGVLD